MKFNREGKVHFVDKTGPHFEIINKMFNFMPKHFFI